MRVGYIGLGIMGSAMARNLLARGHEVTVWNRTRARGESLLAAGARWGETPRAVAAASDVVCTCVADPAAMLAVSDGPDGFVAGLAPEKLAVDFSTIGPDASRALAAACAARGARYLEAPVTGSKVAAEAGTLLLMCGGDAATFDAVGPVLQAVGAQAIFVGPVGHASQVKLIGNVMIAHMLQALSEGAALASQAGISLGKLLEVVQASGYASKFWDFKGRAIEARDFATQFSVDLMHKDLTLALATGARHGVPMPGTAAIREVYQLARAAGHGQDDIASTAAVVDPGLQPTLRR